MKTNELITKIRSVMHMVAPPARELLEQAAEALAECTVHSAECRMKWIPVTERLPDVDGSYIVTACDEGCSYGEGIWYDTVVVIAEYYEGSWSWNENGIEYDLCGIVTHWMPLPEPPKEET